MNPLCVFRCRCCFIKFFCTDSELEGFLLSQAKRTEWIVAITVPDYSNTRWRTRAGFHSRVQSIYSQIWKKAYDEGEGFHLFVALSFFWLRTLLFFLTDDFFESVNKSLYAKVNAYQDYSGSESKDRLMWKPLDEIQYFPIFPKFRTIFKRLH